MKKLHCLCLLFFTGVACVGAQVCPSTADECIQQSGFRSFPVDLWHVCTTTVRQLHTALTCIQTCNFATPSILTDHLKNADAQCSGMQGCDGYMTKYQGLTACYASESSLRANIQQVVSLFNSRLPHNDECLNLRRTRSCIVASMSGCAYLDYYYTSFLASIEGLDKALYICGAEGVESVQDNSRCSDQIYTNVLSACNVACDLTNAPSAGDFCNKLQSQASCIESYSQGCSTARSSLLLPRLDTYSFVNDLFQCNISVLGMLVKPRDYDECHYKTVLETCFDLQEIDKITYKDVQIFVNGDIFTREFRNKLSMRDEQVLKCSKALWSCITPLSRAFVKPVSFVDFRPSIGTFPLNTDGLNHAFDSFTQPPEYGPSMICKTPGYNTVRSTTLPPRFK